MKSPDVEFMMQIMPFSHASLLCLWFLVGSWATPTPMSGQAGWDTARVWTDFDAALQRPERVLRLDLTRSKWKEVDHRLRRFQHLRELVLDRNKIDTIPTWLG